MVPILDPIPGEFAPPSCLDPPSEAEVWAKVPKFRDGCPRVIVDPHPPMREGLSLLLPPEGLAVLGGASTGAGGEALVIRHEPDVALVAADLPDVDGIALVRRLVRRGLRSAVVLYAHDADCEDSSASWNRVPVGASMMRRPRAVSAITTIRRSFAFAVR